MRRLKHFCSMLHHRFLHFIWVLLPKRYEIIKKVKIPYVVVPRFLLGSKEIGNGSVLYHKPSNKIMIFLANCAPFPRYTIYHEYREGQLFKEKKTKKQMVKDVTNKIPQIMEERMDTFSKEFVKKMRKWAESEGEHIEALVDQFILAKEEMSPQDYHQFFQFRITH